MPKVKDLTVDELKELIEQTVERKLVELLGKESRTATVAHVAFCNHHL